MIKGQNDSMDAYFYVRKISKENPMAWEEVLVGYVKGPNVVNFNEPDRRTELNRISGLDGARSR